MEDFNEAVVLLKKRCEELLVVDYERRYDALMKTDYEYKAFNLSGDPTHPEPIDLEIRPVDFENPDTAMLQAVNHNIFAARFRRHLLVREYVFATKMLSKWRSLATDVQSLYDNAYEHNFRQQEVRSLKNAEERKAEVHARIPEIVALKSTVEKFYDKDGNYVMGEAVAYKNAVQSVIEDLDAQLISDNKQLDVFQKMKDMGMGAV